MNSTELTWIIVSIDNIFEKSAILIFYEIRNTRDKNEREGERNKKAIWHKKGLVYLNVKYPKPCGNLAIIVHFAQFFIDTAIVNLLRSSCLKEVPQPENQRKSLRKRLTIIDIDRNDSANEKDKLRGCCFCAWCKTRTIHFKKGNLPKGKYLTMNPSAGVC